MGRFELSSVAAAGAAFLFRNPAFAEKSQDASVEKSEPKPRNENPRTTAAGFDPEALERGAKALREINNSSNVKKVFELMRKQEDTRQAEEGTRKAQYDAIRAEHETERQKVLVEEQKKLVQQQAQTKAQLARYEDELTRKRMQAEHEAQRSRNAEMVKMQEESAVRQEQIRRSTEEHIQAQRRQTEKEKAEIERETIRVKALAEAEGRAHEAKLSEDVNRRLLVERATYEKEKWLATVNSVFTQVGGGLKELLTDQNKLVVAVGGVVAVAAGVYTSREGARVLWGYVDRILGQPTLIRESSRGKYPWSGILPRRGLMTWAQKPAAWAQKPAAAKQRFGDVILHDNLSKQIKQLAFATANTKKHSAPFRNLVFYGPPGTGKTMAAIELAKNSGLDYAVMTGGDVAPLGPQAVTKIHQLFDWAEKSRKGLLLFIDEADAFLCKRNNVQMSENVRSALNALLYRTGKQSRDFVLVLATNRPGDLDAAVTDRIDEVLEFPLPGLEEREHLIKLYLEKYILQPEKPPTSVREYVKRLLRKPQNKIEVADDVTDELVREIAIRTEEFSGREIAKLLASVQGAVYGSQENVLTAAVFRQVVAEKVEEHQRRKQFADGEASSSASGATPAVAAAASGN